MLKPVTVLTPRSAPQPRDAAAVAEWMLDSKLEPPPQRQGTVARTQLLDKLDAAAPLPMSLLLAPPGFGKTTLLAQWRQRLHERGELGVGWLSLDEDDRDPGRLAAYLGIALARAGAEPVPALQSLIQHWQHCDPHAAASAIVQTLRASPRRLVLILDDYDRASGAASDTLLLRLAEHAGPRLHLLLASRQNPDLPLARLAAHGQLARFGAAELALDETETAAVLGRDASPQLAHVLRERTEGWAVALHLAALWAGGNIQRRQESDLSGFSGRSAQLAAYLAEQVVVRLAPELREFLLHTCVIERFNTALADHVRQRGDSATMLARLEDFHGLLVPLDGEHEWFRYHPLFAEYLQQQLERAEPGATRALRRRAAEGFMRIDALPEAVHHALEAGDIDAAAEFIAAAGTWQTLLRHGVARMRSLLERFEPALVGKHPALNLTQAYLHLRLGEFSHAQTLLAQFRDLPDAQRVPFERDYIVVVAWLRNLLDEICANPNGARQLSAQADALDETDKLGRGVLLNIAAAAALGRGDFDQAGQLGQKALQQLRADAPRGANHARLLLGKCAFQQGRLDDADAIYREALAQSENHGHDDALAATVRCLLARLQCERGHYAEAADLLDGALESVEQHDGWFDVLVAANETALTLARINDASGRSVLRVLERIDDTARRRRLARLSDLASAWRLHLMLDQADPATIGGLVANTGAEAAFAHARTRAQHWRQVVTLGFALARWHFLSGRASAALPLLRAVEADCTARGDELNLARSHARIALCLQQRGEIEAALPPLRSALDFVARTRAWQAIVDLGLPAKAMLRLARQHDPELGSGTTRAMTVQTLLEKLQGDDDNVDEIFSAREREVLAQLARGHSNKQIARNLHLSENTVKFHLKNLYKKLDADSRDMALTNAAQLGVIKP